MKRVPVAGITAGAVVLGGGVIAILPTSPSLPDVQVPAIQLSNAEGVDPTVAWLDMLALTSGDNPNLLGNSLSGLGSVAVPGEPSLVVIDPQDPARDFEGILDSVVGSAGSQLNSVTSGPDAVTYLILNNNGS